MGQVYDLWCGVGYQALVLRSIERPGRRRSRETDLTTEDVGDYGRVGRSG